MKNIYDEACRAMQAEFPAAEGWRVHVVPSRAELSLRLLPAFIKSEGPAGARLDVATLLSRVEKSPVRRLDILGEPFTREGDGLSFHDWNGDARFGWEGSPVAVRRTWVPDCNMNPVPVTIVAERDRAGFERLFERLSAFAKSLELNAESIYVPGEGARRRPTASWDDVILPAGMLEEIRSSFDGFLGARSAYARAGLPYRRGFLFAGAPGCGKTATVRAMTANTAARVVLLEIDASLEDWEVRRAFEHAKANSPCLLILEDLDHITANNKVSLAHLLSLLDGLETNDGVLVVATTNHPEKLDPALIHRPSRFDRVWRFGLPGRDERLTMLARRLSGKVSRATLEDAANGSSGFTMAYVQEIAASALLRAISENREIGDADVRTALEVLRRQVREAGKPTPEAAGAEGLGFAVHA